MLSVVLIAACLTAALVAAIPAPSPSRLGIQFEKRDELPTLTLPYATYRASEYEANGDIYHFRNIRFAAPPVGDLRFAKPAPPEVTPGVQDGSYGPSCIQEVPLSLFNADELSDTPIGDIANAVLELAGGGASEDCLFLDIYVPGKAIRDPDSYSLPVVVWFYGGAYTLGSKDQLTGLTGDLPILPLYQGTGVLKQSGGNMIFVTSNYRLGAYGWLAGKTMEREATPNLGLWDQRAALQWVQDYIHLVGGDKNQVSAWGESAGAGSIFHHLTAFGGTQDPLFSKAVLMSPAFEVLFDREGQLEETFQTFVTAAGCPGGNITCLRAVDSETMKAANSKVIASAVGGSSNIGPASDGSWVRQLAVLEYLSGNYWKGLDSLIVSHVADEAALFTSMKIDTDAKFEEFVNEIFRAYSKPDVTDAIFAEYPATTAQGSPYKTTWERLRAFVRDTTFTCNNRVLTLAYPGKTWNMQYSVAPAIHGTDLIAMFFDASISIDIFNKSVNFNLIPGFGNLAQGYQSYMASHAVHGDPNTDRLILNIPPAISWPHPSQSGDTYANVLNVGNLGFSLIKDTQISADSDSHCDFMIEMTRALTNLNGYAPPGTFVPSSIGRNVTAEEASANYTIPTS